MTPINLGGYGISFLAVGYYNYAKLQEKAAEAAKAASEDQSKPDVTATQPLVRDDAEKGTAGSVPQSK